MLRKILKKMYKCWFRFLVDHYPVYLMKKSWKNFTGMNLNLKSPRTLNEKIQWLICYSDTKEWTRLADKILVRDYVKSCGLEEILVPLLGTWNDAREIDFDRLPQKFVLKCNHDSGSVIIVDKSEKYDKTSIVEILNRALRQKYGYAHVEPHYNGIKPMILAEPFLDLDSNGISSSPIDYKFFCYGGKPDIIWVAYNRHNGQYCNHQTRDLEWNRRCDYESDHSYYRLDNSDLPRPQSLSKMIDAARKLSQGFPEVRVDFYDVKGKLYFGEMTFSSDCGRMPFFSDSYQKRAGDLIDLSLAKKR